MNRLDRRLTLLRAKRAGVFDTDQYWLERARRARVARRVRSSLRRMQPVFLLTPRWSSPRRFLDDVSTDLLIGTPEVVARTLDCGALHGLTTHQAWAWFVSALTGLSGLVLEGPAWQAVSRHGFRHVMHQALRAIQDGGARRCLLLHGVEHVPLEALEDLLSVFDTYRDEVGRNQRMFNLLLAGTVGADHVHLEGAGRPIVLQDYTGDEAVEALVEDLGPLEEYRLRSIVELVGGVPQLIEHIASLGDTTISRIVADPEALWSAIGPLAGEIRGAFDILTSDGAMHARLEALRDGPQPEDPVLDSRLVMAGVANRTPIRHGRRVQVRAPAFVDLV